MAAKKERGRFCIKFKEKDPLHEAAIRLLETQRPRGKAQLVAEALKYYTNRQEASGHEENVPPGMSREAIENIVLEVLQQQLFGQASQITSHAAPPPAGLDHSSGQFVPPDDPRPKERLPGIDHIPEPSTDLETFDLITDALSAFRGG